MSYIGPAPNPGQNREVDDISSGFNGSEVNFTLQVNSQNVSPGSANAIIVSLGGVVQNPGTDYTIAASTLTFTTAPASGLSFFGLVLGQQVDIQSLADGTSPTMSSPSITGDLSIADKIVHTGDTNTAIRFPAADTVTAETGGSERVRLNSSGNLGIGEASPSRKLAISDATFPALRIKNSSTSIANGTNIAGIEFEHADSSAAGVCAGINALMADTSTGALHMTFSTGTNVNLYRENMRLDMSGNLGIGLTDIAGFGGTYRGIDVGSKGSGLAGRTDNVTIDLRSNTFYDGSNHKYGGTSTTAGQLSVGGAQLSFSNAPSGTAGDTATLTERLNIGNLGVFTSTAFSNGTFSHHIRNSGTSTTEGIHLAFTANDPNTASRHFMMFSGTSGGTTTTRCVIDSNGNLRNVTGTYGSISDVALKENIVDANSQWDDIKNVRVRVFNFKVDDPSEKRIGVVAQELETVCPKLIDDLPDRDSDGNQIGTSKKSVKYSILYMKAIKALQEAQARIETLETKVAALEAA